MIDYIDGDTLRYQDYQRALHQVIKHYASKFQVSMLGYSMGGRLLFSTMPHIHELMASAAFISSGLPLTTASDYLQKKAFDELVIRQCRSLSPIDFVHWWYQLSIYKGLHRHPKFPTYCEEIATTFDPQKTARLIRSLSSTKMPMDDYKLPIKVNYIYGELDQKYKTMATQYPLFFEKVTQHAIPNASHLCWFEQPTPIQKILNEL
jgi:pimeloyl-ACP methyl ester carboxylesterase